MVVVVVVQMINGNGVSVQALSYVQPIGWQNTWEQARRPRHPFPALMAGVNPGRVPVYTALPAHPEQASQDLPDPLNRNVDHLARTATAKSLWSARQAGHEKRPLCHDEEGTCMTNSTGTSAIVYCNWEIQGLTHCLDHGDCLCATTGKCDNLDMHNNGHVKNGGGEGVWEEGRKGEEVLISTRCR